MLTGYCDDQIVIEVNTREIILQRDTGYQIGKKPWFQYRVCPKEIEDVIRRDGADAGSS